MEELNSALHKFNLNIVEVSRQVSQDAITFCMTKVILPLLDKIGELDLRFECKSPMPNQAYFPGLKVSSINEFELTVVLTNLITTKSFESCGCLESHLFGYGRVLPVQGPHPIKDVLIESDQTLAYVSAQKVRYLFGLLVARAVTLLPFDEMVVDVTFKEPRTVVRISRGSDVFFFELVPALSFLHEWPSSAWAWPPSGQQWLSEQDISFVKEGGFLALSLPCSASPADPSLFRISFSGAEKFILRPPVLDGCTLAPAIHRKSPERILRIIRESDKDTFSPIGSYHIKTVLLHQCLRWPSHFYWTPDKMADRFLELLRELILSLENHNLPHFFIKDCNLLSCYTDEELRLAAARLRAIYHDVSVAPSTSIRLQC